MNNPVCEGEDHEDKQLCRDCWCEIIMNPKKLSRLNLIRLIMKKFLKLICISSKEFDLLAIILGLSILMLIIVTIV